MNDRKKISHLAYILSSFDQPTLPVELTQQFEEQLAENRAAVNKINEDYSALSVIKKITTLVPYITSKGEQDTFPSGLGITTVIFGILSASFSGPGVEKLNLNLPMPTAMGIFVLGTVFGASVPAAIFQGGMAACKRMSAWAKRKQIKKSMDEAQQRLEKPFRQQIARTAQILDHMFRHPRAQEIDYEHVGADHVRLFLTLSQENSHHFLVDTIEPTHDGKILQVIVPSAAQSSLTEFYKSNYADDNARRLLEIKRTHNELARYQAQPSSVDLMIAKGHSMFPKAQPVIHSHPEPTPDSAPKPRVMQHE